MEVHDEANEKGIMWFAINGLETKLVQDMSVNFINCLQNAKNVKSRKKTATRGLI